MKKKITALLVTLSLVVSVFQGMFINTHAQAQSSSTPQEFEEYLREVLKNSNGKSSDDLFNQIVADYLIGKSETVNLETAKLLADKNNLDILQGIKEDLDDKAYYEISKQIVSSIHPIVDDMVGFMDGLNKLQTLYDWTKTVAEAAAVGGLDEHNIDIYLGNSLALFSEIGDFLPVGGFLLSCQLDLAQQLLADGAESVRLINDKRAALLKDLTNSMSAKEIKTLLGENYYNQWIEDIENRIKEIEALIYLLEGRDENRKVNPNYLSFSKHYMGVIIKFN